MWKSTPPSVMSTPSSVKSTSVKSMCSASPQTMAMRRLRSQTCSSQVMAMRRLRRLRRCCRHPRRRTPWHCPRRSRYTDRHEPPIAWRVPACQQRRHERHERHEPPGARRVPACLQRSCDTRLEPATARPPTRPAACKCSPRRPTQLTWRRSPLHWRSLHWPAACKCSSRRSPLHWRSLNWPLRSRRCERHRRRPRRHHHRYCCLRHPRQPRGRHPLRRRRHPLRRHRHPLRRRLHPLRHRPPLSLRLRRLPPRRRHCHCCRRW